MWGVVDVAFLFFLSLFGFPFPLFTAYSEGRTEIYSLKEVEAETPR
jgi:hypothetical protein